MSQSYTPQATRSSIRDALFIFYSKKHVFRRIFIIIFVLVNAVAWFSKPVFNVSASVLVLPTIAASLTADVPRGALESDPVTPQVINSEVNILLSDELLREVAKKLGLTAWEPQNSFVRMVWNLKKDIKTVLVTIGVSHPTDPTDLVVKELRDRLEVKPVTMSNIIEVSMDGDNPEEITTIVNTLVDLYINRHIEVYQFRGGINFFGEQTDRYKKALDKAEAALREFQVKWSIINIAEQQIGNVTVLSKLREQATTANAQITEWKTRLNMSQEDLDAMTRANTENAFLLEMNKSMLPLIVERERVGALYPKNSPEYRDIDNQVRQLQARFKKELKNILSGGQIDLQAAIAQRDALEKAINQIEEESVLLTEKEIEQNRLKRELAKAEKNYLLYSDKTEEARIENQKDRMRVSNVVIASNAHAPSVPKFPKKGLMGILSIAIGLLMGVAGTFMAYYLDHTVKQPKDLPHQAQTPILSAVSNITKPQNKGPRLSPDFLDVPKGEPSGEEQKEDSSETRDEKPDDSVHSGPIWDETSEEREDSDEAARRLAGLEDSCAEADIWMTDPQRYPGLTDNLRVVKNKLKAFSQEQKANIILFTGADNKVGTTTLLVNLGLILCQDLADRRILLVDACLGRPSLHLHDMLNIPKEPGVLDCLREDLDAGQIKKGCLLPNLDVITVGDGGDQISSPFDLQRFDRFLSEVSAEYDYVLIDSDPVLKSSHSRILTGKVNGVIVVVEANVTRWEVLVELRNQLENDDARLIGGVLNKRRFPIPRWVYRFI